MGDCMAIMASEDQSLRVAIEFVKFKNTLEDILYGPGDRPPRFGIDSNLEPKKIGGSIVFTAVPKISIDSDNPQSDHYFERRKSVIVKCLSIANEEPSVPFLETAWVQKITDEKLETISESELWPSFRAVKKDPSYPLA